MVPDNFYTFFATSAGAGAALIGLLFVAISITPESIVKEEASRERRAVANNTFTAMLNAFFISIGALMPGVNLGAIVLVFGVISLSNGLGMNLQLFRIQVRNQQQHFQWRKVTRYLLNILAPIVLYGYECFLAIQLILSPSHIDSVGNVTIVLIAIYGWGLEQAWELLGLHRFGLLSIFLFWRHPAEENSLHPVGDNSLDAIQNNSAAIPDPVDSEQR